MRHVKIYSEPGKATTVKIYRLPRYSARTMPPKRQHWPRSPSRLRKIQFSSVEDDDDVRANSVDSLRELGYRVMQAPDGAAALRVLEAERSVRLLFTDVGLPGGMSGTVVFEVLIWR